MLPLNAFHWSCYIWLHRPRLREERKVTGRKVSGFGVLVILLALSCAGCDRGVPGFPGYALPNEIHGPGIIGGGEAGGEVTGEIGPPRVKLYSVATDVDLGQAKERIRARLIEHMWTVVDAPRSKIGTAWYEAKSPQDDACLAYLLLDQGSVSQTNNDPLLARFSAQGWRGSIGSFQHVLAIFSGACGDLFPSQP